LTTTISADVFVGLDDQATADSLINAALGQPEGTSNFARELSPTGEPPATAKGSFGNYTDAQWYAIRDALALAAPQIPSVRYYARGFRRRTDGNANRLLETNSPTAVASIGAAWSPSASMADAGVTPVVSPF
jgi:hypothetical protein